MRKLVFIPVILFALNCQAANIDDEVRRERERAYGSCISSEITNVRLRFCDYCDPTPDGQARLKSLGRNFEERQLNMRVAIDKVRKTAAPRCKAEADKAAAKLLEEEQEKEECPVRPAPVIGMSISDVLKTNWGKIFDKDVTETRLGTRVTYRPDRRFCPDAGHALIFENGVLEMIMR